VLRFLGAFFGGKKGDVYLAYRAGEVQIERAKILDWSMDSIRFEIPKKLERAYGTYILAVKNAVGTGYRLIKLSSDEPPMLGVLQASVVSRSITLPAASISKVNTIFSLSNGLVD